MFDLDFGKLVVIGIIALIAIGPKELPAVLRTVGQYMTKIRRMAAEFQGQFQEAMREAEMADMKKHVDEISDAAKGLTSSFDPLGVTHPEAGSVAEDKPAPAPPSTPAEPAAIAPVDVTVPLPEPVGAVHAEDFVTAPVAQPDAAGAAETAPLADAPQARDRPA
jgi:sec-independent protein translocase protein TatB